MIKKYKHHFIAGFVIALTAVIILSLTVFKWPTMLADLLPVDENPACPTNLQAGTFIKVTDFDNNIFTIDDNNNFLYYQSLGLLRTWLPDPESYTYVNSSCLDSLSLQVPATNAGINYRPGSYIVKHRMGSQLYTVWPGNKLVPISADSAKYLYANSRGVYSTLNIQPFYWPNYTIDRTKSISAVGTGEDLVAQPHPGMLVNINGIKYYVYTDGKLREVTEAGFTANNFKNVFVRKLSPTAVAGMQYGSVIDSKIDALVDQTQSTAYPADTGVPKLPPVAPTLSAETTDTNAKLTWTQYNGSNFKYYRLVRSELNTTPKYPLQEGDVYRFLGRTADTTTFTDNNVKKDKTYYYTVCAQTTANTYLCSNSVKVTIQNNTTPTPPTAPTLTGSAGSDGISLSWSADSSQYFKAYHVVRSTTNSAPKYPTINSLTDITTATTTSYSDTSVANSTTYYYSVCTEDTYDQITCSNTATVTTSTPPTPTTGTTYYIRPDGGTYEQCNGKTNAAYVSGGSRDCAVNHPFQLFPPTGDGSADNARIAGGDTVIIANGNYMMGYGASGATACSEWYPWGCVMSTIPSGPDKDHPTRILGAGYSSGCLTKPELWGTERASQIFDLTDKNNIDIQCLELTDRSSCIEHHSGELTCNRDSFPYGKWAQTGIYAEDSSNVTLKNLDIHGLSDKGIWAGRLQDWTVDNVRIAANGLVGWDGDIDGSDANTGTMTFKRLTVEWNGCGEVYSTSQPVGCWGQTDISAGYGDGLGTGTTGGDWIFEDSSFLHNTSDGLDLLYHRNGGTITITRLHAEGNAGNQVKTTGNTAITDSVIIGNCAYFEGQPFTHDVDNCRALGAAVSITADSDTPILFYNNSVYSEGDGMLYADGTGTVKLRNNIFYAGTDYLQPFETSFYLYTEGNITFDQDYNLAYNAKNNGGMCSSGTHNICNVNPVLTKIEKNSFDMKTTTSSPVIDRGTSGITSKDYLGHTRPQGGGVDMGAYEVK